MGLNTSWIVTTGMDKARVLDALGLVETELDEGLDIADVAVAELPGGHVVVHYGDIRERKVEEIAGRFPQGRVLWGYLSETVMYSAVAGMADGRQVWSVLHNPDIDPNGVQVEGEPPAELAPIVEDFRRQKAEDDDEIPVDYVFAAPMALTRVLTGYDPERQSDQGFRIAERRLSGKAGERQAERLAFERRLVEAVRAEVYPAAQARGFGPPAEGSGHRELGPDRNTLVRQRDGWSEELLFQPGMYSGVAKVAITFFTQRTGESRGGRPGQAIVAPPRPSLLQLFTGPKKEPAEEALARAIEEARMLVGAIDEHLREGTPNPHIRPANYHDDLPGRTG